MSRHDGYPGALRPACAEGELRPLRELLGAGAGDDARLQRAALSLARAAALPFVAIEADAHAAGLWLEAGEPAAAAAADRALAQFADREAYQFLTQAADLFDDAGASDAVRVDVMTMTGEALRRIGDPSHREVLLEAGRIAQIGTWAELRARPASPRRRRAPAICRP